MRQRNENEPTENTRDMRTLLNIVGVTASDGTGRAGFNNDPISLHLP